MMMMIIIINIIIFGPTFIQFLDTEPASQRFSQEGIFQGGPPVPQLPKPI
jgi:hypothetical protein